MVARARARARRQPAPEPASVAPPPPAFDTYRLEQLGDSQCRFACTSHGTDHRFCGRPATHHNPDKPAVWCLEHQAVVFTPKPVIAARKLGRR